ncbi:hypothetical protein [Dactylosporangium matsuzakiense]|nr:hypothetical protein [Dactylosporangium matsuzakiense]UWZ49055.1 hypothetical protein Dmats_23265 [Dactylosporangium matsuzakiense]
MAFLVEMPDGGFIEVEERDDLDLPEGACGALGASPLEGTTLITFGAAVRTGLSVEEQDDFADWLYDRVVLFAELGGQVDGWSLRDDGTWMIHAYAGDSDERH